MCDFPSWKEKDNDIIFLTDAEAKELSLSFNDVVGHSAIERVYPKTRDWTNKEGFPCPKDFVKAINSGKCTWMMQANGYKEIKLDAEGQLLFLNRNGEKLWCINGQLHRADGPAVECTSGEKFWYLNGKLHRVDGPAVEYASGDKFWYINGKLHRVDGPAIEYADGEKLWYLNGQQTKL